MAQTAKQNRLEPIEAYVQRDSDMRPHITRLRDLVVDTDAKVVVELGVRYGYSTAGLLHGVKATGGHLWAVDNQFPAPFLDRDMTFVSGDDTLPAVMAMVPDTIDFLFIDTSHALVHTATELAVYGAMVRPGGVVACHDVELDGVRWPLLDFYRDRGARWVEWRESHGLAVVYTE